MRLKKNDNLKDIQDINISTLEDITENLSRDDILKIADEVRQEFEKNEDDKPEKSDLRKWYDINYRIVNAILFPLFIGGFFTGIMLFVKFFITPIDLGGMIFVLIILGIFMSPFFFIIMGFSYFFSKAFNKDSWKDSIR